MLFQKTLFFRKPITPWYDSNAACWLLIVIMVSVFIFAVMGIFVGAGLAEFLPHLWFPGLLAVLSGFLVVKVFLRVRKRSRPDSDL